jgi:hypothetical protein
VPHLPDDFIDDERPLHLGVAQGDLVRRHRDAEALREEIAQEVTSKKKIVKKKIIKNTKTIKTIVF